MAIRQLSVFIENSHGSLAEVAETISDAGVDIRALSLAETPDYGILRLIVDDTYKALDAIKATGRTVTVNHMLGVRIDDSPGGLTGALRLLTDGGFDVEYMYAFLSEQGHRADVVLRVSGTSDDRAAAEAALSAGGYELIEK